MEKTSILLIEDNREDEFIISRFLSDHNLTTGRTLKEGIELVTTEKPDGSGKEQFDIILLDLSLPDSSGYETFERLNAHTADRVPVVVLTGLIDTNISVMAIAKGAQDYLIKDELTQERLLSTLRFAIARHSRAERLGVLTDAQLEVIAEMAEDIQKTWLRGTSAVYQAAEQISTELTRLHQTLTSGLADEKRKRNL